MANIRTHPHEWEEVLNALNTEGEEKANQLIRKYNFDDEGKPRRKKSVRKKYKYFSQSPEGVTREHKSASEVAEHLNVDVHVIYKRLEHNHTEWLRGELIGWQAWREEIE